jgi:predicted ATPase
MLLRFRTRNLYSFRDEVELSLLPTRKLDATSGQHPRALPLAVIYGANASGKTNLLAAIQYMQHVVARSVNEWADEPGVPMRPFFMLDDKCRTEPSMCEIDVVLDGTRYIYGFELSDEKVEAEWLYVYPKSRRQVWFEREADSYSFPSDRIYRAKQITDLTRKNALFLSTASQFDHPTLTALRRWFGNGIRAVNPTADGESVSNHIFRHLSDAGVRERTERMIRSADLGISRIELDIQDSDRQRLRFLHYGSEGREMPVDWGLESQGTISWLTFVPLILSVLDSGQIALVDEMDSSLHPKLVAEILRLFKNPDANLSGAQLIGTAHDTSLIGSAHVERPLDREDVWLVRKKRYGSSELYPLTDTGARKDENLERALLRGRLGGVPDIAINALADDAMTASGAA